MFYYLLFYPIIYLIKDFDTNSYYYQRDGQIPVEIMQQMQMDQRFPGYMGGSYPMMNRGQMVNI